MKNQDASAWLRNIDDAQNIEHLENVPLPLINRVRLFMSRLVQPIWKLGWYNPETGKLAFGPDTPTPGIAYTTASAASLTLTCTAGHRYKVYYAGCLNVTQPSGKQLTATIGGNAITYPLSYTANTSQTYHSHLIGGTAATAAGVDYGISGHIWLSEGDTLTITLLTYAAGNDTEHVILYEDYRC